METEFLVLKAHQENETNKQTNKQKVKQATGLEKTFPLWIHYKGHSQFNNNNNNNNSIIKKEKGDPSKKKHLVKKQVTNVQYHQTTPRISLQSLAGLRGKRDSLLTVSSTVVGQLGWADEVLCEWHFLTGQKQFSP